MSMIPAESFTAVHPRTTSLPAPGADALNAAHLRQLLMAALPDKSRRKRQGWFGDTDFLLTRAHVDDDGDTYHDGLFLTVWGQWDFWIADAQRPTHERVWQSAAARAGAWLRRQAPSPVGFTQLYRRHTPGAGGGLETAAWSAFDLSTDDGPPDALGACREAWRGLLDYWHRGLAQRSARYPLHQRLLDAWPAERVEALALLPAFAAPVPGAAHTVLQGGWQGTLRASSRPPRAQHSARQAPASGAALRLGWRRNTTDAGFAALHDHDEEPDSAWACYQIDVERDAPSRAGEPVVHVTYAQRLGDMREPLPPEAAEHIERLLRLLADTECDWADAYPSASDAEDATDAVHTSSIAWLDRTPPPPPHAADEEVLPGVWMALSHTWQAAGRAQAAQLRRSADRTGGPPPGPLHDPRTLHAGRVLQLAREITRRGDSDTAARFHRRFAFAPHCYADRAAAAGQRVGPVLRLPGGGIAVRVGEVNGRWVRLEDAGMRCEPWVPDTGGCHGGHDSSDNLDASALCESSTGSVFASIAGLTVEGDTEGVLWGRDDEGRVLWSHPVATSGVTGLAVSGDGREVVAGSAGGDLVVLRKTGGGDAFATGTSRYGEVWRVLFWEGEAFVRW